MFLQGTPLPVVGRVNADRLRPLELRVVLAAEVSVTETGNTVARMSGAPIVLAGRPGVDLLTTIVVRPEGIEPPAYRFEACRSIQLSYGRPGDPYIWSLGHLVIWSLIEGLMDWHIETFNRPINDQITRRLNDQIESVAAPCSARQGRAMLRSSSSSPHTWASSSIGRAADS